MTSTAQEMRQRRVAAAIGIVPMAAGQTSHLKANIIAGKMRNKWKNGFCFLLPGYSPPPWASPSPHPASELNSTLAILFRQGLWCRDGKGCCSLAFSLVFIRQREGWRRQLERGLRSVMITCFFHTGKSCCLLSAAPGLSDQPGSPSQALASPGINLSTLFRFCCFRVLESSTH